MEGRKGGRTAGRKGATEGDRAPLPPFRPSELPTHGRILGVDWGERRIGLAVSDPTQTLAQPLATLTRRAGRRFPLQQLKQHMDVLTPTGLVMGLPVTADGGEDDRCDAVRRDAARIAEKTSLPITLWDERMTTGRALGAIHELQGRTRGREGEVDRLAATVILQTFLDHRNR